MGYIKKIISRIFYILANSEWQKALIRVGYNQIFKSRIYLKEVNLTILKNQALPILENYELSVNLVKEGKGRFTIIEGHLFLFIEGIKINIQTTEEIFIAHEIFVLGLYNIMSNESFNVVDIGMNVGMASLYFANKNNIHNVFSYEPFEETYKQGINNINLNPNLSDKIKPFNFGLGHKNRKLTVSYSPDHKGRIGIFGTKLVLEKISGYQETEIEIKDAGESVQNLFDNDTVKWILKVDTEGAEYEILNSLKNKNILSKFHTIVIEWHEKGPGALETILLSLGFKIISQTPLSNKTGLIYAIK